MLTTACCGKLGCNLHAGHDRGMECSPTLATATSSHGILLYLVPLLAGSVVAVACLHVIHIQRLFPRMSEHMGADNDTNEDITSQRKMHNAQHGAATHSLRQLGSAAFLLAHSLAMHIAGRGGATQVRPAVVYLPTIRLLSSPCSC